MPLTIDISDATIEKTESRHHLHLWGVQTSLWKATCISCGNDAGANKVRCDCGDCFFCCQACRDHGTKPLTQCTQIATLAPSKARPSPNHRRAVIFQSKEPQIALVWAEIRGSELIIDHDSLKAYCNPSENPETAWLDLAVINPAVKCRTFTKIGHGIAMGFPSTLLALDSKVPISRRNSGIHYMAHPGQKIAWPGPLLFFCYGYDLSDYVKVDPSKPGDIRQGAEKDMTKLEIWNELDSLRRDMDQEIAPASSKSKKVANTTKPRDTNMVWRWKIKETGTSMRILDVLHRDISVIFDYLTCSRINPVPALSRTAETTKDNIPVLLVRDPSHPGYAIPGLWDQTNRFAKTIYDHLFPRKPAAKPSKTPHQSLEYKHLYLPECPPEPCPMAGAFFVGLRWMVHYNMDIPPPFRAHLPYCEHGPMTNLMWTVRGTGLGRGVAATTTKSTNPTAAGKPAQPLRLFTPSPTTDSLVVMHARNGRIFEVYVRALLKYLDFTDPRAWSRRGPRGFEAYWKTFAAVGLSPRDDVTDPYVLEDEMVAQAERCGAPSWPDKDIERLLAYMTGERLGLEEWGRREEIVGMREGMLERIAKFREGGGRFSVDTGL